MWTSSQVTPALDIGIAKSGSNLVHSPLSHILCLTPCVKARNKYPSDMYIYIYGSDQVSAMHPSPLPQITLGEKRRKKEEKILRKRNV